MTDTVFYYVLNISVTSIIIGTIIMLLRLIKAIPRQLIYALWGLVYLRLVMPVTISSKLSLLNLAADFIKNVHVATIKLPDQSKAGINLTLSNSIRAAKEYFPVTYKNQWLQELFHKVSLVWFLGATVSILTVILFYLLSIRNLKNMKYLKENIYTSNIIDNPITFGLIKQEIIVPESLHENSPEFTYVILHESFHIKGYDNLKRILAFLICCVHWFNPFVWIFTGLFLKDMEHNCDIKVAGKLSREGRLGYAKALVNMGSDRKIFGAAAFGRSNVRSRVLNVISYKRLTGFGTVISFLFILAVTLILLTNPF